jgi:hypothetical protein
MSGGRFSAFFVNDTMCLVLTPLVPSGSIARYCPTLRQRTCGLSSGASTTTIAALHRLL